MQAAVRAHRQNRAVGGIAAALAWVARGGWQVHGGSIAGRWRLGSRWLGGDAGRRGPGACGPFVSLGKCLVLPSANGSRFNAPGSEGEAECLA